MENQFIQKISQDDYNKYSKNNKCSCCKCITTFCYCSCNCECHQEQNKSKSNNLDYDDMPNLNIDELRMKSLNEYTSNNVLDYTKKTLNSSRSMANIDNHNMNAINGINLNSFEGRNQNQLRNLDNLYMNKSQEGKYLNNFKTIDNNTNRYNYNDKLKSKYNAMINHYKTQSNFNTLKKYYQLNNDNNKDGLINNNLKTQSEFNKLLSRIKDDKISNKRNHPNKNNIIYNTYIQRENSFYSKNNNSEINTNNISISNNSDNFINGERKTIDSSYPNSESNGDNMNKKSKNFGYNTEYNKPFRPYNNKSIDLRNENIYLENENKSLINDRNMQPLKNNYSYDLNINKKYQNGGNNQFISQMKEKNDNNYEAQLKKKQKTYNNRYNNKTNNKYIYSSQSEINKINTNYSEDKKTNNSKCSEEENIRFKSYFSKTMVNTQNNRNELIESKDINGDNFIITFGAKSNNELKKIICSLKDEIKSNKNKLNGKNNSDENINNIINDYKKLKKKYEPNRLFTGLQNNINNLNENINNIKEMSNKNNISNFSTTCFNISIKGEINKDINENNELKIELKEAKAKIKELTKMVKNYQKEINSLKGQIINSKNESISISKINTINDISTSNNNSSNNKTKIGKNSFIIKIPENLIKRRMNKDKQNRNYSSNEMTNSNINNIDNNESNTLLDLTNNTYKKRFCKNNNNNFNNLSNISNNTFSNCLTNNNINNISNYMTNSDVYTKKITTTMKKKFRKSASQKLRINKIDKNIYIKPIDFKRTSKLIYTIITKNGDIELLSFDVIKHKFNIVDYMDFDNFEKNFKESFLNEQDNNNSIFLNDDKTNNFYIVTGKNCDKLYKYYYETNKIKKICTFKNNHSNGCLLKINNKIICLSGNHNKKVEMFSEKNNSLINLPEMNIERNNFSCCLIKNEFIFSLFGFNFPTQQYLKTIEFYDLNAFENYKYNYINIEDNEWKYLKYKDNNSLNLFIKGHLSFNYLDEKIFIFGGFNGYNNEAVDCFYQLNLGENFNLQDNKSQYYMEPLGKKLNNIYKDRIYYFGNNSSSLFECNQKTTFFTSLDSNFNAHILDVNNFKHNIYYFH